MANYKPDLSCQSKFIPVDFTQQNIPGTFEYAIYHIVDNHLDLPPFDEWYNNDNGGAAAYPPSVMLKIVLCGYSRVLVSSPRIARACETNITFMSLSGDAQPHYTSIAHFVANMKDKIEPLFTQVLMICDREGLIGRNMFAIDGCGSYLNGSAQMQVKNGVVHSMSLSVNKLNCAEPVNGYLNVIKHKIV
jgi:transposase